MSLGCPVVWWREMLLCVVWRCLLFVGLRLVFVVGGLLVFGVLMLFVVVCCWLCCAVRC